MKPGDAVLDVGCGTGTVLNLISSAVEIKGFGVDVSQKMLEIAKEKNPDFVKQSSHNNNPTLIINQ